MNFILTDMLFRIVFALFAVLFAFMLLFFACSGVTRTISLLHQHLCIKTTNSNILRNSQFRIMTPKHCDSMHSLAETSFFDIAFFLIKIEQKYPKK